MVLKVIAWIACAIVVFAIAAVRAAHLDGRSHAYEQGYAFGGFVTAFGLALGIGFAIQRSRKRTGLPPWIGLIAVGLIGSLLVLDVGRDVAAGAACAPVKSAYGKPPATWTYGPGDPQAEAKVRKAMGLSRGSDVSFASRRGATTVVLVAVPHAGSSFVDGVERGGKEVGATASDGPHDTTALRYPTAYAVVGMKGCNAVMVDGQDEAAVTAVADAIFG